MISSVVNIIITVQNNSKKLESFNKFLEIKKNLNEKNISVFYTYSLFLYLTDISKEFKNDLLNFLKDRSLKKSHDIVFRDFLTIIELVGEPDTQNLNSGFLNCKIKIFNNFFAAIKIIHTDEFIFTDEGFIEKYNNIFSSIILTNLNLYIQNINEDVYQLLVMFLKYFYSFYKGIVKSIIFSNYSTTLNNLHNTLKNELISHIKLLDLVQFNKDFEFNFSNSFFLILNLLSKNKEDYINQSTDFLQNFENNPSHLFIFVKSFIINFPDISEDVLLSTQFTLFNSFILKYLILAQSENLNDLSDHIHIKIKTYSLMDFYKLFLEHDLKSNFTSLINDIILISVHKISPTNMSKIDSYLKSNSIISKIFEKMKRDKNNFNIMDDYYYYILDSIHKINNDCKEEVERLSNKYLNDLIQKKERLMMIETRMFKFIDFSNEQENNTNTIKSFFAYIFSKPYEKKNLPLINEYIKILFDYFFTSSLNTNTDKTIQLSTYRKFISIFPEAFFNYLTKLQTKELKFLNNILINLEKFNKNLYSIIVNEFYQKYFIQETHRIDYVHKYSIFLTLLKPFKNHKRTLMIKEDKFIFDYVIIEKELEIKFSMDLKELKNITKLSDRNVVLYLIEFLNGLDEHEKLFPIVKTLLKYNVKSSYIEYKSSLMKALIAYFQDYIAKISKYLTKSKPTTAEVVFINKSKINFEYFFNFISDNIYDRPVENLLVYLDLLKLNVDLFDSTFYHLRDKIKNGQMKKLNEELINSYEGIVFNRRISFSLISLLRQSWYFVRHAVFTILKNKKFEFILFEIKDILKSQVAEYLYSLRQMDAEGGVNLFILLVHHFKDEFLNEFSSQILNYTDKLISTGLNMKCLELFHKLVKIKEDFYINMFVNKISLSDANVCNYSVHSYYVLMRNLLEQEKESSEVDCNLLLNVGLHIIEINYKFSVLLINNGVAEFSTDFDVNDVSTTDGEDKGLISLWCSAKYSIESLNMILDLVTNNFKIISKKSDFEDQLRIIVTYLSKITNLMIEYKHMGAICTLNDSLLKVVRLLNMVDDSYKSYREVTNSLIKDFLETKLINEEVCSTLRRSAGIPFILTTLIKSYIPIDKHSTHSHNKVVEILKASIDTLLNHYKTYQGTPDVAVHCLHILRVISDDTHLKPFAKEFYDHIILNIVDGLGNINWSIKNACMLLFSRLIKNSFVKYDTREKNNLTFIEYFTGKDELKNKIFRILRFESERELPECNDSLIILITFFSKFKKSKIAEINEKDLTDMIDILMNLSFKNNKLFRKLLSTCILNLYGNNINLCHHKILNMFNIEGNYFNNKMDFVFNLVKHLNLNIKNKNENEFINNFSSKCLELLNSNIEENFFLLNKIVKFFSKVLYKNNPEHNENIHNYLLKHNFSIKLINNKDSTHSLDIEFIFNNLKKYSRRPFYSNFIKNSVDYFLKTGSNNFINFKFGLISHHNEELLNFILKKYPGSLLDSNCKPDELISSLINDNFISKVNVNISTKIISYILKSNTFTDLFTYSIILAENLLIKLIELIQINKPITKLLKKLFKFISNLFIIVNKKEYLDPLLKIVFEFCTSNNEENIRFTSIKTFESILLNKNSHILFNENEILYLDFILIIFTFILNDEHPEIRNYSCQVFTSFNTQIKLLKIKIFNSADVYYSNEYLMMKIISLTKCKEFNLKTNTCLKAFYEYLIKENLYFLKDKAKLNTENKVFYYEPENRFIDNVEIKINILKSLITESDSILVQNLNLNDDIFVKVGDEVKIKPIGILMMLESFVEFISDNFEKFKHNLLKEKENENFKKFPFIYLRNCLYDY